jgi:hypothetical protein
MVLAVALGAEAGEIPANERRSDYALMGPAAFLELRGVALHPAHDRRMRHRQAALGHHFHQIAQTELEPKIPAHAQNDDFAVEVATFEQLRHRLQLAHGRPQPSQHANVADRAPPFAPEP